MSWEADAAAAFKGGPVACCPHHRGHERVSLVIDVGAEPAIGDWPAVGLGQPFTLDVFDAYQYWDTPGYCAGDDEVSRSILENGCWEGFETALAVQILAGGDDGWMIDVGCHVGWYSTLAVLAGRPAVAVDADPEVLAVAALNVARAGGDDRFFPIRGFVNDDTRVAPAGPPIRLAKADVEGCEAHAVRALRASLAAGRVDFLLVEMTDQFGGGWRDVLDALGGYGYQAFAVPDKADSVDLEAYAADPLGVVEGFPLGDLTGRPQVNALFARKGIL